MGIGTGSVVFTHNENHYCRKCHTATFVKNCTSCDQLVHGQFQIYNGKTYHPECLTCFRCELPFPPGKDAIYNNEGKKYCKECCTIEFEKSCHKCYNPISPLDEGGLVVHKNRNFHNACFGKV